MPLSSAPPHYSRFSTFTIIIICLTQLWIIEKIKQYYYLNHLQVVCLAAAAAGREVKHRRPITGRGCVCGAAMGGGHGSP